MEPSKLLIQLSLSLLLPLACWSDCWSQTTHEAQTPLAADPPPTTGAIRAVRQESRGTKQSSRSC